MFAVCFRELVLCSTWLDLEGLFTSLRASLLVGLLNANETLRFWSQRGFVFAQELLRTEFSIFACDFNVVGSVVALKF